MEEYLVREDTGSNPVPGTIIPYQQERKEKLVVKIQPSEQDVESTLGGTMQNWKKFSQDYLRSLIKVLIKSQLVHSVESVDSGEIQCEPTERICRSNSPTIREWDGDTN